MAKILSTNNIKGSKIIFHVCLDYEEAFQLEGRMDNICLFSEDITNKKVTLIQKGHKGCTKYFLVPRQLRRGIDFNEKIECQRIETKTKIFLIYSTDKLQKSIETKSKKKIPNYTELKVFNK